MKKINLLLVLALSVTLFSCGEEGTEGGGASSNTTVDFKSDGTFLKDFEHKSTAALKGGIVWNGKNTAQTIEIGVSNADQVLIGPYGGFDSPKNEGEATIGFKLAGRLFEKGETPILIKEGDVFTTGSHASDNVLSCYISLPNREMAMFNGEAYGAVKDYEGTATITKLTDDFVEGTIDFKRVDGTSSITIKFSEPYTDNWTGKGFVNPKNS